MDIQRIVDSISKHWIVVLIGLILVIVGVYQLFFRSKSDKTIEKTYQETISYKDELLEIKRLLSESNFDEISSADYPGITMVIVSDIRKNINPGDAYVLDVLSKGGKARLSVYQTRYNELCFAVTDSNGESEKLKIQQSSDGYHNNRIRLYAFDYREKDNSSFIRIIVNNKEVGKVTINRKLGLQDNLDFEHGTIGSTYNDLGCSDLLVSMFFVSRAGFSSKEMTSIRDIFFEYLSKVGYSMREAGCKGVIHLENELNWKNPTKKK